MQSMIGNRFGTLTHQSSIHMSSSYNTVAITRKPYHLSHFSTKPHVSFSHSSFSLGNITFRVGYPSTSLTDQKIRPLQAFTADHFKEVVAVARELERSGCKDVAKKLMKLHRPEGIAPGEATDWEKNMGLIKILIGEEMFDEAREYSVHVESNMSSYKQPVDLDLFNNLKFVILCGLNNHEEANQLLVNKSKAAVGGQNQEVGTKPTVTTATTAPAVLTTTTAQTAPATPTAPEAPTSPPKPTDGSDADQNKKQ